MKKRKSKNNTTIISPQKNISATLSELSRYNLKNNLPVILIVIIYTATMLYLSLRYHRIGGQEVETDFYADFAFNTKKLMDGDISLDNFGFKGPLYYILLALFKLLFGEFFRAGLIMNVLAAGGVVLMILLTLRTLFGMKEAVLTVIFSISTFAFLHYTYSVGTDMVSVLFSFLTIYFLLARKHTTTSLIFAGLFACLAFLTRNNTAFLYPAGLFSIFLMDYRPEGIKKVGTNAVVFMGSSILFGLPWYLPNWILRGTPLQKTGLYVLKLQYTHIPPEQLKSVDSLTGLIVLDPPFFFKKTCSNIVTYFARDISELIGFWFGMCILIGVVVLVVLMATKRHRFSGPQWAFFSFPVMHFAVLTLIHYNIRFAFFRIPFYAILLFAPFMYLINNLGKLRIKMWISRALFIIALVLFTLKFYPGYREILKYHENRHDPVWIFDAARVIKRFNFDERYGVMTRTPHLSYYSGLRFIMIPTHTETTYWEFLEFAQKEKARFFWIDNLVISICPALQFMVGNIQKYPGFTPIFACKYGVLYLIDEKNHYVPGGHL